MNLHDFEQKLLTIAQKCQHSSLPALVYPQSPRLILDSL